MIPTVRPLSRSLVLAPLVLLGTARPADDAVELVFAPEEGTTLVRTFESRGEHDLEEEFFEVGGNQLPAPERSLSAHSFERIVVTDELLEVEDGHVVRLRRTFDELANGTTYDSSFEDEEEEFEQASRSDLEGESVDFVWDDDEGACLAEDDELDDDLLEGLIEDMDMRLVLPDGEVEPGDSWEIDPRAYLVVMWPGGLVGFYSEDEEGVDPAEHQTDRDIIDSLDGEGRATFEGVEDHDGVLVAVIAIELEVECAAESVLDSGETRTVTIERDVEGLVLWGLEGSHLVGMKLEADSEMRLSTVGEVETPDGDLVEVEHVQVLRGSIDYDVGVEVVD